MEFWPFCPYSPCLLLAFVRNMFAKRVWLFRAIVIHRIKSLTLPPLSLTSFLTIDRVLSREDSNSTMLYLEYTTRACRGSVPDEERYCDNRATKVTARGQILPGADSFLWTIPTTLDLQLSRGQFHLYDYNGHSSESFFIRPASRRRQGGRRRARVCKAAEFGRVGGSGCYGLP